MRRVRGGVVVDFESSTYLLISADRYQLLPASLLGVCDVRAQGYQGGGIFPYWTDRRHKGWN
jgi:hypothetical protein